MPKVGYDGTTAYLDDVPLPDGTYVGTNKHTDLPVHLRWDDDAEQWVQVCVRTFELVDVYNERYAEHDRPECSCVTEGRPDLTDWTCGR